MITLEHIKQTKETLKKELESGSKTELRSNQHGIEKEHFWWQSPNKDSRRLSNSIHKQRELTPKVTEIPFPKSVKN